MEVLRKIVPGISLSLSGEATIAPSVRNVLFDIAIQLEESTNLPIDIEHVVAAIVLAARNNEIDANAPLVSDDSVLVGKLAPHVKSVFALYGGKVGRDE